MDYLKQFFKSAFSPYVEVVHDDMISFGYEKGLEIHDLRLNTKVINDALQASQSEARLECGRIGRMNLVYTPLPGIVTIQVKDLDIRVRPNFTGLALRKLFETLQELGDLDNPEIPQNAVLPPTSAAAAAAAAPLYSCYGAMCPPSNFTQNGMQGPEIHNTQARLAHPCRIPRAPPIVRRAKFVGALPSTSPHFQRPVKGGTIESLPSCLLQGLPRGPSQLNLESFCPDLSLLSSSIASSCGATHARVFEGCEEIKNLLSNCVESVVSLTPPEYDQLEQIKLPSLRVRTSEIWREAIQQRAQRAATSGAKPAASASIHFAQSSAIPQQSVGALHATIETTTPAAAAAAATAAAAAATAAAAGGKKAAVVAAASLDSGKDFNPYLTGNNMGLCMQNAPVYSVPVKPAPMPYGPSFLPPAQSLSFGIYPQTFPQQTAANTSSLYTGGGPFPPALHAGVWGPPAAAAVTPGGGAPLSSKQGPPSPSSLARSYLQSPNAFGVSTQLNYKLNKSNSGLGLTGAGKGMPPDK